MSRQDQGSTSTSHDYSKRPKLQRACDLCRKKKSDGTDMPNNRCSKCISYGIECTYDIVNRRPPAKNYVDVLESRLQKMEELVDRLRPQGRSSSRDSEPPDPTPSADHAHPTASASSPLPPPVFSVPSPAESNDLDPSDDETETQRELVDYLRNLSLPPTITMRYHGKSSSMMLLQAAMDIQKQYTRIDTHEILTHSERYFQWSQEFSGDQLPPHTEFPPPEVMKLLIDGYFENINFFLPLLHRQILERHLEEGLHLRDQAFGSVVLLVCANGCRWTDDPRVAEYGLPHIPGWKLFQQVERARNSIFTPPRLYDVQKYTLMAEYLGSFVSPHNCWASVGLGLRIIQDVGAHRHKTYASMSKIEGEQWKRAFWVLITFDRIVSFNLGRPCALQDEDFDVEPMVECDDEYWDLDDPESPFKQPPGKPSTVAMLNCLNRLLQILAFASRTLYSINKSKILMGFVGPEWEERIVAELDSLLNKWIDTVPDHLRWDPHREDIRFLKQSTLLYSHYYQHQIFVHRPFLPSMRKSSRLSLPSLAICTNAARCCVHINDIQTKRTGVPLSFSRVPLSASGVVLLLNMWGGKRSGYSNSSAAADVQKCLSMLKHLELTSPTAGRLLYVLTALYSAGGFDTSKETNTLKRARDSDPSMSATPDKGHSPPEKRTPAVQMQGQKQTKPAQCAQFEAASGPTAPIAGGAIPEAWNDPSTASSPASFDLPISTEDLGRVPFHHGFSPFFDPTFGHKQHMAPQHAMQDHVADPNFMQPAGQMPWSGTVQDPANYQPNAFSAGMAYQNGAGSTTFDDMYASVQGMQRPNGLNPAFQYSPSQFTAMNQPGRGLGTAPDLPELTETDLALADNTLEMWSTAPTSLDWGDWGSFINSVSGGMSGEGWPMSDQPRTAF
ncbi:hypothetical protein BV20DRAFT_937863 [Pilatotrama ljubarskyi]|nr:hypothetical protein BV20DRAFT_937863 [Pilatotrama ljubarskyi]